MSLHSELQALSDNVLLARLRRLQRGSTEREVICEILVSRCAGLVQSCIQSYRQSPEPAEDLFQVGYVGLLKAINGFDLRYGDSLSAHARPTAPSLDAPLAADDDHSLLGDFLGEGDPAVVHAVDIEAVRVHLDELPEREQRILMWRFCGNLTQEQIGDRLGISQMHVSRLLERALTYLRVQITESV